MKPVYIFMTGTDTGSGKTTVSCALARALISKGIRVGVSKPVETGCEVSASGDKLPLDALLLTEAANVSATISQVCPYQLLLPAAPSVAASHERVEISVEQIFETIAQMSAESDVVIIEGAGGLLVPIARGITFADLARQGAWNTVVVVGSKLGALNHACLTFEALRNREIPILGYVLNELFSGEADTPVEQRAAHSTNRETLSELALRYGMFELGYMPRIASGNEESVARKVLQWPLIDKVQQLFESF